MTLARPVLRACTPTHAFPLRSYLGISLGIYYLLRSNFLMQIVAPSGYTGRLAALAGLILPFVDRPQADTSPLKAPKVVHRVPK